MIGCLKNICVDFKLFFKLIIQIESRNIQEHRHRAGIVIEKLESDREFEKQTVENSKVRNKIILENVIFFFLNISIQKIIIVFFHFFILIFLPKRFRLILDDYYRRNVYLVNRK